MYDIPEYSSDYFKDMLIILIDRKSGKMMAIVISSCPHNFFLLKYLIGEIQVRWKL